MATKKKSSKKKSNLSSAQPRNYSQLYKSDTTGPTEAVPVEEPEVRPAATKTVDWGAEYGYVLRDLRTLTIVSVVIFAAIIGVGLFF